MSLAGPDQRHRPRNASSPGVQRRLLDGVTETAGRYGLPGLTVDVILREAKVSRASFYQYFSSVDDCFWHAYRHHAQRLVDAIATAVAREADPELVALEVLVRTATEQPNVAQLLMREGLGAGAAALEERESLIEGIEQAINVSAAAGTVDLPAAVLIGGVFRFLSLRLDGGGPRATLARDVLQWARTFSVGPKERAWSSGDFAPRLPAHDRGRLESRAAMANAKHARNQRERIIWATAATIHDVGYREMTVQHICACARVSRRTFYNTFSCKADAFKATYEYAFQQTVAASTPAFFSARVWRERIWHGFEASTAFLSREPLLAYLGFVECYSIGREFALRVHDTQLALTLFLEDGYRQRPEAEELSRDCSELTAATVFEAGFQACLRGPAMHIRRVQPLSAYIALVPFLGREAAGEFVKSKLRARRAGRSSPLRPQAAPAALYPSALRSVRAS